MKIAINKCYGGFRVSREVIDKLREKGYKIPIKGEKYSDGSICSNDETGGYFLDNEDFKIKSDNYLEYRSHKDLIEAIETSTKPNGNLSRIVIVEIPDDIDWFIDDYDGIETIHEEHRSW